MLLLNFLKLFATDRGCVAETGRSRTEAEVR